jgi:eukaryotic-like serine/threonine-protein kinase
MDSPRQPASGEPVRAPNKSLDATILGRADNQSSVPSQGAKPEAAARNNLPDRIGRYRIERLLGQGGFGLVFLAYDEQLDRLVAVKVPHAERLACPGDADAYLAEARIVASLEHPHIVPVYDVGGTAENPFFVVSKYVEGTDLAARLKNARPSWQEATEIVASVADALHYAHKQGLVHRDVKPGNILIDRNGKPYVVDFGLALRDENFGKASQFAGTPAYMSPEQARGEGHRVDGRSDIFSLAVVFYELLAGRSPFRGDSGVVMLQQIATQDPRPPRQYDDTIPKELERICLKALSKRATDRYSTALDLADDLRHFLGQLNLGPVASMAYPPAVEEPLAKSPAHATTSKSDSWRIKIVPKGLRSFDAHDADFFLELLPGPRDRDGFPDIIRFWKTRIDQTDRDETFRVGLVYGPSGCGKSSMVKAGLLPRLAEHVLPIYVEATAEETESRLLHGLRKRCPDLQELDLKGTLAALRLGQGIPDGTKVLIVLDQFEQWLHSKGEDQTAELVQALRQCDGGRVQCIVLVRDDFWMAVTRFLAAVEIELAQGQNIAAVDLFDTRHAERVLEAYGRAYGALPENAREITAEQRRFVDQTISGLAEDGKVICVRLALFAEMMKGKAWTPGSLESVGGTEGVGVTFLDETFSAATANPSLRLHQKAARAVLKSLLPEKGSDIKGNMRSRQELLDASELSERTKEFDDLIRILDSEVRLITPTDPDGIETTAPSTIVPKGHSYFQLTHDYLVPSLREWLTRKQKETHRGRTELRLAERSAQWKEKRETRHLPSLWEFLNIRLLSDKKSWTGPQRAMMRKAKQVHGIRVSIALVLVIVALFSLWQTNGHFQAASLLKRLVSADLAEVPGIVHEIDGYRRWANPMLKAEQVHAPQGSNKRLHLDLALLPVDESRIAELRDDLLLLPPTRFGIVRDALVPHSNSVIEPLWTVALDPHGKMAQRFQSACALATYTPEDKRWSGVNTLVADHLVSLEASALVAWRETLYPARAQLIEPLSRIYTNPGQEKVARTFATETLADFAADRPKELFNLVADAEMFQFPLIFAKLASQKNQAIAMATEELARRPSAGATDDQKEALARRQANVAVALLLLDSPDPAWPTLKFSPDPTVRSYVIHLLSRLGVGPESIIGRLDTEPDVTIRRALVLTLGQFSEPQLSQARRKPLIEKLLSVYENEPDAGFHGATEWLLRRWGQSKRLDAVVQKLKCDEKQLQARKSTDKRHWYINTEKQTFAILDADEFVMGSPKSEPDRYVDEVQHRRRLKRRLAIATTEVTSEQFRRFQSARPEVKRPDTTMWVKTDDSPQIGMTWYEAAQYCNWLSEQEHIDQAQWCYEPNKDRKYRPGMRAKDRFWELKGYRLLTEAEWQYACRAGTATNRFYGFSDRLLPHYVWCLPEGQTRTAPAATMEPNDFGIFDTLGNVYEWCFDRYGPYAAQKDKSLDKVFEDEPSTAPIDAGVRRMVLGGAFDCLPSIVRAANRSPDTPDHSGDDIGFRPARTYP